MTSLFRISVKTALVWGIVVVQSGGLSDVYGQRDVVPVAASDQDLVAATTPNDNGDNTYIRGVIDRGVAGDIASVRKCLYDVHNQLTNDSWRHIFFKGEAAFGTENTAAARRWTDLLLSFPQVHDQVFRDYSMLCDVRRMETKYLYQTYAALRQLELDTDTGARSRREMRAELTERLWSRDPSINENEIQALIAEIDDSFGQATHGLLIPDEIREAHSGRLDQLMCTIPANSAVVEIVRYEQFDRHNQRKKPHERERYACFIMLAGDADDFESPHARFDYLRGTPGVLGRPIGVNPISDGSDKVRRQELIRLDLGDCTGIDRLVAAWRQEIANDEQMGGAARDLTVRLWMPIAAELKEKHVERLYIVGDGSLHELPWGALPISKQTCLIDQFAIAHLPFVEYLMQGQLDAGPIDRVAQSSLRHPSQIVTVSNTAGDLTFASTIPQLLSESAVASERLIKLAGDMADAEHVLSHLPQASVAHFAVHGMFARNRFALANKLEGLGPNSPQHALKFSSLSLSNSRLPANVIAELDLSRLNLLTLAACETGVGDWESTEGHFSLGRAFHMAGCRDVVTSLWRVDDRSTAMLMSDFYRRVLDGARPIDALAQSQRAARRGDLPPLSQPTNTLAQSQARFPLKSDATRKVVPQSNAEASETSYSGMPVSHWAALQLSGPGNLPVFKGKRDDGPSESEVRRSAPKQADPPETSGDAVGKSSRKGDDISSELVDPPSTWGGKWKTTKDQVFSAVFLGIEGESVLFGYQGKTRSLPLAKLHPSSRTRARGLADRLSRCRQYLVRGNEAAKVSASDALTFYSRGAELGSAECALEAGVVHVLDKREFKRARDYFAQAALDVYPLLKYDERYAAVCIASMNNLAICQLLLQDATGALKSLDHAILLSGDRPRPGLMQNASHVVRVLDDRQQQAVRAMLSFASQKVESRPKPERGQTIDFYLVENNRPTPKKITMTEVKWFNRQDIIPLREFEIPDSQTLEQRLGTPLQSKGPPRGWLMLRVPDPMSKRIEAADQARLPETPPDTADADGDVGNFVPTCAECGGSGTVDCFDPRCNGGTVLRKKLMTPARRFFNREGVEVQVPLMEMRDVRVECRTCKEVGHVACPRCHGSTVDPLFPVTDS